METFSMNKDTIQEVKNVAQTTAELKNSAPSVPCCITKPLIDTRTNLSNPLGLPKVYWVLNI